MEQPGHEIIIKVLDQMLAESNAARMQALGRAFMAEARADAAEKEIADIKASADAKAGHDKPNDSVLAGQMIANRSMQNDYDHQFQRVNRLS